ncbi:MAG: TetR/AcrR family transcriptional regulator [Planctomycetes bacterium]|nr:TetR/AcrR family transcriptional regulator [Planctomycetota bacterium]
MKTNRDVGIEDVQSRLLDSAEKLFCQKGFDRVSVRELTAEANCNIASVNYHFGSKEKLYTEMFRRQFTAMINGHLETINCVLADSESTLEGMLRAVIEPAIRRISQNERGGQVMKLLIREIMNQHIDPEPICKEMKTKFFDELGKAILRFVPEIPEEKILMVTFSFDGVVLHPFLFMDFYENMMPGFEVGKLIEHMVKFVAAAIRGYAEPSGKGGGECG